MIVSALRLKEKELDRQSNEWNKIKWKEIKKKERGKKKRIEESQSE